MSGESRTAERRHIDMDMVRAQVEKFHDWLDVHDELDDLLYGAAKKVGGVALASIFEPIPEDVLRADKKIDAINHNLNYLRSNPFSAEETEAALGLLGVLHGEFAQANTDKFIEFADNEKLFERMKGGQTFIFVGSHLEFQDVGFNLGYLTRAAQANGIDRFDTRVTLIIGRMLGYLEVMGMNVIDDILRKASNVQKTFPVSGGEAINEGDITDEDLNRRLRRFRAHQNQRAREQVMQLVYSNYGHVIIEAGSGSRDAIDEDGFTVMEPFAKGTREDLYRATKAGAVIYPIFGDYGDDKQPSLIEFGPAIDHLDSVEDAHRIGEMIASIGNRARGKGSHLHPDVSRFNSTIRYGSH